ncbi:hypothetical protein [Dictyobacter kobayashii]|uniref:Cysteine dioxygenase n=1 Tax=Dictyobacter kobayashii TaxID=2014872 RepID=A0A402AT28_9CHLR|nr:hypothetical protein [Dictyobacter kobayashii]GCE22241.1 hypothetical protein KDK_60410 [Dictyobacter kobayashii]
MFSTIATVDAYLCNALAQPSAAMESKALIQYIGTREMILSMLKSLITDEEQLRRVASMSYPHRNGFDRIVLIKSSHPEYKLRLHIWWPQHSHPIVETIHNHAWNFSSSVLTGAFQFQSYIQDKDGDEMYHYSIGSDSIMKFVAKTKLICVYDAMICAGCSYSFQHTIPHRVINVPDLMTSTLILQTSNQKISSDVFIEQPFEQEVMAVSKFTRDELQLKLKQYIVMLEKTYL